jgi:hypothetical protein
MNTHNVMCELELLSIEKKALACEMETENLHKGQPVWFGGLHDYIARIRIYVQSWIIIMGR